MSRDLTPRELAILIVIASQGCTIAEAADRLGIRRQTAKNHLGDVYSVLEVHSLVGAFVKLGWLAVP